MEYNINLFFYKPEYEMISFYHEDERKRLREWELPNNNLKTTLNVIKLQRLSAWCSFLCSVLIQLQRFCAQQGFMKLKQLQLVSTQV